MYLVSFFCCCEQILDNGAPHANFMLFRKWRVSVRMPFSKLLLVEQTPLKQYLKHRMRLRFVVYVSVIRSRLRLGQARPPSGEEFACSGYGVIHTTRTTKRTPLGPRRPLAWQRIIPWDCIQLGQPLSIWSPRLQAPGYKTLRVAQGQPSTARRLPSSACLRQKPMS